jgi:hypothetical protein
MLRQCRLCPYLSQAVTMFQQVIKDDKVRQAFQKKKPAISDQTAAPPVPPVAPAATPAEQPPVEKTPAEQAPVEPLPSVQ